MPTTITCTILALILYSLGWYHLPRLPNLLANAVMFDTFLLWFKVIGIWCSVNCESIDKIPRQTLEYIVRWYSRYKDEGHKWLFYMNSAVILSVSLYTKSYVVSGMFVLGYLIYTLNIEQWAFKAYLKLEEK